MADQSPPSSDSTPTNPQPPTDTVRDTDYLTPHDNPQAAGNLPVPEDKRNKGETRVETDSMGKMQVPADALYGASTARAVENFPISHQPVPAAVIHAFGYLKAACAQANLDLGKLDAERARAIIDAAEAVAEGEHDDQFPVDIYQTGSGTSTNMNANEVIATLANRHLQGKDRNSAAGATETDSQLHVHPNDHVNIGQSSNDTFPTAMHIAGAMAIKNHLTPVMEKLTDKLDEQEKAWDEIVKIGRTHLMDATPIRVGQVFSGYRTQARHGLTRARHACELLHHHLPIGGTAVGTGLNTHPDFAGQVSDALSQRLGLHFEEANNHPAAQAAKDLFVDAHGCFKTIAVSLSKIANDLRHLGSGPRCGIGELKLPAIQPGSSIMPGKVNPVLCESVIQVACRVIGNDAAITTAGLGGVGSIFELNVAMPVIIDAFLESVHLLGNVVDVFVDKLLADLEVNEKRCRDLIEQSLMMVTSLAPQIGYDKAASLAKQAMADGKTIREAVKAEGLLDDDKLDTLLDPDKMTRPTGESED